MNKELKVGMYVRKTDGLLWKPKKIEIDEDGCYLFDEYYYFEPEQIYKSSHNIIDLIEVGDYVNGYKVTATADFDFEEEKFIQCDYIVKCGEVRDFHYRFYENAIESIVTKEQFKSVEYEVE